jgi:hypothetical protein
LLSVAGSAVRDGATLLGGALYLGGDTNSCLSLPNNAVQLASSFTLTVEFTQAPGTGGYLFSVSTVDGATRQASLYLASTGTFATLYYLPEGAGTTSTSVRFTVPTSLALNDGAVHRVQLAVDNALAVLSVDGVVMATTALAGPIAGCATAGITCVPLLGARSSATGAAFGMTGTILRCELIADRSSIGADLTLPPPVSNNGNNVIRALRDGTSFTAPNYASFYRVPNTALPSLAAGLPVVDPSTGGFTVGVTFVQHQLTSGYLFAKSLQDDSKRFCSLYSRQGVLVMYYATVGGTARPSVEFNTNVDTGEITRLLLSVTETHATVFINGVVADVQPIDGRVDDCDGSVPGCVFYVGGRAAGVGLSAFVLSGSVWGVRLYQRTTLTFDPEFVQPTFSYDETAFTTDSESRPYLDLLAPSTLSTSGGVTVSGANVLGFNGAGVAEVNSDAASALLSQDIALAMVVRLAQNSSGYLIANADPDGRSRYLGLWHSGSVVVWYFRVAGDVRLSARFELPSSIADGFYHELVFRVGSAAAILQVDGVPFAYSLGGLVPIACGGGCRVMIGGRSDASGSAFRLTGSVAMARVYVDLSRCRLYLTETRASSVCARAHAHARARTHTHTHTHTHTRTHTHTHTHTHTKPHQVPNCDFDPERWLPSAG